MENLKPQSLLSSNKKNKEDLDKRLIESINIKKEKSQSIKKNIEKRNDKRQSNQRPPLSANESFFSLADKQSRISTYLKILVQLIDELSIITPNQLSITNEEKWNLNSDLSIPKIASSFNNILIQVIENYISSKSEREQEIFITALKKEIEKNKDTY